MSQQSQQTLRVTPEVPILELDKVTIFRKPTSETSPIQDKIDLINLLTSLKEGKELPEGLESLLSAAIQSEIIRRIPADEYHRHLEGVRLEKTYLENELKALKQELVTLEDTEKSALEALARQRESISKLNEQIKNADKRHYELIQEQNGIWNKLALSIKARLSTLPYIGQHFSNVDPYTQLLKESNAKKLESLQSMKTTLSAIIAEQSGYEKTIKKLRAQTDTVLLKSRQFNRLSAEFEHLSKYQPCKYGYLCLAPEATLVIDILTDPNTSSDASFVLLENFKKAKQLTYRKATLAQECAELLTEAYHFPVFAAEIAAWYLTSQNTSENNAHDIIKDFIKRNTDTIRIVKPGYLQLLLSLATPPNGTSQSKYISHLSTLSADLPSLTPTERYFIARDVDRIPASDAVERYQRLISFVDALTIPKFEDLTSFEKFLLAARLACHDGEPLLVIDKFEQSCLTVLKSGAPASIKTYLAAEVLMNSPQLAVDQRQSFLDAHAQIIKNNAELSTAALLPAAFVALIPGDTRQYVLSMHLAESALCELGYERQKARALALVTAVPVIEMFSKQALDNQAINLARKVMELDQDIATTRHANPEYEEIRKLRLHQELLQTITTLKELYAKVDGINTDSLWQQLALVDNVDEALKRDGQARASKPKQDTETSQHENSSAPKFYSLQELIEINDEVTREIRELKYGGEYD